MDFDPNIRLVTICDISRNIKFSDHRPGVSNLLSPEESKRSLEMAVNAWKERKNKARTKDRAWQVCAG
jgi:hypothetical protein